MELKCRQAASWMIGVALAGLISGCSQVDTGVEGTCLLGGGKGYPPGKGKEEEPTETQMNPYAGATVTLTALDANGRVYEATSDGRGEFKIPAPSGKYRLEAKSGPQKPGSTKASWSYHPKEVEIVSGKFTKVELKFFSDVR